METRYKEMIEKIVAYSIQELEDNLIKELKKLRPSCQKREDTARFFEWCDDVRDIMDVLDYHSNINIHFRRILKKIGINKPEKGWKILHPYVFCLPDGTKIVWKNGISHWELY